VDDEILGRRLIFDKRNQKKNHESRKHHRIGTLKRCKLFRNFTLLAVRLNFLTKIFFNVKK